MAIVLQNDSLGRGIEQAGSALGQALQFRTQQGRRQKGVSAFEQALMEVSIDPVTKQPRQPTPQDYMSALTAALQMGATAQDLAPYTQILAPILKEQARAQGAQSWLSQNVGTDGRGAQPFGDGNYPGETDYVPKADENRVGPKEQTVYQQGGQAGMDINPPQEGGKIPSSFVRPGLDVASLSDADVVKLAGSPYKEHQSLAQAELARRKPELKEKADIRKEDRVEIKEYSAPFRDISSLESSLSKLEKAKDLILNRKVSLDENQFRRLSTAILEDKGWDSVAQYFKTDEQKMLFALLKDYFKTKDLGGSNPSTKEVLLSLSTLPSENMGKGANIELVNTLIEDAQTKLNKANKINEIRKSGKQYTFGEFQDVVERDVKEKLGPIQKQHKKEAVANAAIRKLKGRKPSRGNLFMLGPDGKIYEVPVKDMKKLEDQGGILLHDS